MERSLTEFDQTIESLGLPLKSKSVLNAMFNLHVNIPDYDEFYESCFDVVVKSFLKIEKKHTAGYALNGDLIGGFEKVSDLELSTSFNVTFSEEDGEYFVRLNGEFDEPLVLLKVQPGIEQRVQRIRDQEDPQKDTFTIRSLLEQDDNPTNAPGLNESSILQVLTYKTEIWTNAIGYKFALTVPEIIADVQIKSGCKRLCRNFKTIGKNVNLKIMQVECSFTSERIRQRNCSTRLVNGVLSSGLPKWGKQHEVISTQSS